MATGSSGANTGSPNEDVGLELRRRRVFTFFGATLFFAVLGLLAEESDIWTHVLDDTVLVLVGLALLIILIMGRKAVSFAEVRRQNNLATALLVVALVFQLAAIPIEASDSTDFANEPPLLIVLVIALFNRFIP